MRNIFGFALAAIAAIFVIGYSASAQAGDACSKDISSSACDTFLRQQQAAGTNPKPGGDPRCVWVVSNEAHALVLRSGASVAGAPVTSWRLANLNWKSTTFRGKPVMMVQVCFDKRIPFNHSALTLCGLDGHSVWRGQNLKYVQKKHVPKNDPACVGGKAWCGARGL